MTIALVMVVAGPAQAQNSDLDQFRTYFGQAMDALGADDTAGYTENLELALPLLPDGHVNRPFVEYHLARANAMTGDSLMAARWLSQMLIERIEGLMLYYSAFDSAFNPVRHTKPFKDILRRVDTLRVTATHVQGNVYVLEGAGCQIVAQIGQDGILLVDAGYALAAPAVYRALRKLSKEPVRYLINTHHHEDHVGGNATLGANAAVIAHPKAREALLEPQTFIEGVVVPPHTGRSLPTLLVGNPISIEFNGETVHILPLPGHTEGDLLVRFEGSDVLHMGDRYFPDASPYIWPSTNVTPHVARMDSLLTTLTPDTKVIAGHGPVTPAASLNAAHQATLELIDFVLMAVSAKKSVEQAQLEGKARGFPEGWIGGLFQALQEE
ncbi:MAG: MBL fold metallo-hydrolase [Planctomycetota bacterium]|jgi:glyoxylase-like metal-dependent hydrolase (beta-lactamase superfamily II)